MIEKINPNYTNTHIIFYYARSDIYFPELNLDVFFAAFREIFKFWLTVDFNTQVQSIAKRKN